MFNLRNYKTCKGAILCFVILGLLFIGCKKTKNSVGGDLISAEYLLGSAGLDTFSIYTTTLKEDSVLTSLPLYSLLGAYNDPTFGVVNASFYTQLLPSLNPNFGTSPIYIDSFVLALEYAGIYGKPDPQTFIVERLNDTLARSSLYYQFTTKAIQPANLMMSPGPTVGAISPNPNKLTVVDSDTLADSQLRLFLDTNLARTFINDSYSMPGVFATNEAFTNYFKGLKLSVLNQSPNSGKGAVLYLNTQDPASKATIYYKQNGTRFKFDFFINNSCAYFNHVDITNAGTNVLDVINGTGDGQKTYYAQAMRSRARIHIPGLEGLPANAVIQKAKLFIPISYYAADPLFPSFNISVSTKKDLNSSKLISIGDIAVFDQTKQGFIIDLKSYAQLVSSGQIENNGIWISPRFFNTTVDRIVFNGSNSLNKFKPKLALIYTTH